MKEPDYDCYSLEQLRDIEAHIDKEAHPKRHQRILDILNDPLKLKKLEAEHKIYLAKREIENKENSGTLGAVTFWIYGAIVAITGVAYGRGGHESYVDSIFLRIVILLVCIVAGYKYFTQKMNK